MLKNIFWLSIDKVVLLVGNLLISALLARYLGGEMIGLIFYGITLYTLAGTVSQWGANFTIFNFAITNKKRSEMLLESSLDFRLLVYLVVSTVFICWIFISRGVNENSLIIASVVISGLFFGLDAYQYYFNGTLNSKYNANSAMICKLTSMCLRVGLIAIEASYWVFIIIIFFEGLFIFLLRRKSFKSIGNYGGYSKGHRNNYIVKGLPLVFAASISMGYSKLSELVLANYVDISEYGIYALVFSISYAWTFLPMAIGISLLNKVRGLDSLEERIQGYGVINFIMILISLPVFFAIYQFSDVLIRNLYGEEYLSGSEYMLLLSCSALLASMNFIHNRFLVSEFDCLSKFILIKSCILLIVGLPITYYLVTQSKSVGAAASLLILELLSLTLINYSNRKFSVFSVHLNILFAPKNMKKVLVK